MSQESRPSLGWVLCFRASDEVSARDVILSDTPIEVIFQAHRVAGRMQFLSFFFLIWLCQVFVVACGIWFHDQGVKLGPPASGAWSLSHRLPGKSLDSVSCRLSDKGPQFLRGWRPPLFLAMWLLFRAIQGEKSIQKACWQDQSDSVT